MLESLNVRGPPVVLVGLRTEVSVSILKARLVTTTVSWEVLCLLPLAGRRFNPCGEAAPKRRGCQLHGALGSPTGMPQRRMH